MTGGKASQCHGKKQRLVLVKHFDPSSGAPTPEDRAEALKGPPSTASAKKRRVASPQTAGARIAVSKEAVKVCTASQEVRHGVQEEQTEDQGKVESEKKDKEEVRQGTREEAVLGIGELADIPIEGDTVQVYSVTAKCWCTGEVQTTLGESVFLQYLLPSGCKSEHAGKLMTKLVHYKKLRWQKKLPPLQTQSAKHEASRNASLVALYARQQAVESRTYKLYNDIDSWSCKVHDMMSRNEANHKKKATLAEDIAALHAEITRLELSEDSADPPVTLPDMDEVSEPDQATQRPADPSHEKMHALAVASSLESRDDGKGLATPESTCEGRKSPQIPLKEESKSPNVKEGSKTGSQKKRRQWQHLSPPRLTPAEMLSPRAKRAAARAAKRDALMASPR